ncbi:hypothetical protein [Morganella morganii]|uniref:hypothetical protein n=1 Tax=Morganella morganii TaxID=582 RepID=UPI00298EC49E|nr:hypothetical protein [Morganella morganii]MDW7782326.1 hypothetical protein [Morganella morganii]MDW7791000.1 hypothetical protein [Morganella morganii]
MKKIIVGVSLSLICLSGIAATYTKEQLNSMVGSGDYPDQGETQVVDSKPMAFDDCKNAASNMFSAISDHYPVRTAVDSSSLYIGKAWTNDGVVMVTCSEPDKKMIISQSPYK